LLLKNSYLKIEIAQFLKLKMSMLLRRVYELIVKVEKPTLGRWNLKSCNEISTSINSVYQNRDHCGDTICKTPKKASEYKDNPR